MTVITLTVPRTPDARTLQRLARELEATTVQVREEELTPSQATYQALAYQPPMTEEERAEARRIVLAATDGESTDNLLRWYEEDREDRPLPGRE